MRTYLLTFCLLISLIGRTQSLTDNRQGDLLGKGHLNLGMNVGEGYRGTYSTIDFVNPHLQYFLRNGWSIALEATYLESRTTYKYKFGGVGLSTRYYFLRQKRFALFAQAGALYGKSQYYPFQFDPRDPQYVFNHNLQVNVGLGIHYRLAKRWSVEVLGGRSWLSNPTQPGSAGLLVAPSIPADYNRWQVSFGVHYRLK